MKVYIHLESTWTICDERVFIVREFGHVPRKEEAVHLTETDSAELQAQLDALSDDDRISFKQWVDRHSVEDASTVSGVLYTLRDGTYEPHFVLTR